LAFCALVVAATAHASHSLVDRVKEGPAAAAIRESYQCLETGEASEDDTTKLYWYERGKEHAETSVLALHLLQSVLVHVSTLLVQQVLAEPERANKPSEEDRRG